MSEKSHLFKGVKDTICVVGEQGTLRIIPTGWVEVPDLILSDPDLAFVAQECLHGVLGEFRIDELSIVTKTYPCEDVLALENAVLLGVEGPSVRLSLSGGEHPFVAAFENELCEITVELGNERVWSASMEATSFWCTLLNARRTALRLADEITDAGFRQVLEAILRRTYPWP